MAKWNEVEDQVQGDLKGLKEAVARLEGRVSSAETRVSALETTSPTPTPPPPTPPPPTPTPPQSILSVADQQAVMECMTKWERVAIRFELGGVTFDWRDSSNQGHHIARGHPKQFGSTIAEAYQNWLELSADTRVARR